MPRADHPEITRLRARVAELEALLAEADAVIARVFAMGRAVKLQSDTLRAIVRHRARTGVAEGAA